MQDDRDGQEKKPIRNFCESGSPGTHESVTTGGKELTKYGKARHNVLKKIK
jgi:hypothetical protein